MESVSFVNINLNHIEENLELIIDSKVANTLFTVADALENGEAEHQLVEGFLYDYELSSERYALAKDHIINPHIRKNHVGTISPNIFVGTLTLPLLKNGTNVGSVLVEVRSVKSSYRDDYRDMLEFITERCTDLLMHATAPVTHNFETDFDKNNKTLYQKFAFIKSIISSDEFSESVHRIVSAPVTRWTEVADEKDIRNVRRFKSSSIKSLISGKNRTELATDHYLTEFDLNSLPNRISSVRKSDSIDTPENRFVKFALDTFLKFCFEVNKRALENSRLFYESDLLQKELESFLQHSVFKEISTANNIKLNSPILQRKEGYREILRVWLMFDLAAKLVWKGGEDIYSGGKKDIATLYEYWLFFKLLDLFKSIFEIEPKEISELIKETADGLNLQLKQGSHTALSGVYDTKNRKLNIRFNYNRSFSGQKDYPDAGSWTTTMRPDYTLSFWPAGISENEAEIEELIVHIHFDAKYKIANMMDLMKTQGDEDLALEKEDQKKGVYKNADLLKMHAYKDAIRRTGGAYVLYPGDTSVKKMGFHEIIPGLGAFPVRPSRTEDGISDLKNFILEVINHFVNRASQREKAAYRTYEVYKEKPLKSNQVNEPLPETYGRNRSLIPDDTFVLVGFYNAQNLAWILETGLYNARADSKRGSLRLGPGESGAKYLLLHTAHETRTGRLLKIIETGPRVFSKQTLIDKGYPTEPSQNYYLVYKVTEVTDAEFLGQIWDITKLEKHKSGRGSALPFSVTLTELMNVSVKPIVEI